MFCVILISLKSLLYRNYVCTQWILFLFNWIQLLSKPNRKNVNFQRPNKTCIKNSIIVILKGSEGLFFPGNIKLCYTMNTHASNKLSCYCTPESDFCSNILFTETMIQYIILQIIVTEKSPPVWSNFWIKTVENKCITQKLHKR